MLAEKERLGLGIGGGDVSALLTASASGSSFADVMLCVQSSKDEIERLTKLLSEAHE